MSAPRASQLWSNGAEASPREPQSQMQTPERVPLAEASVLRGVALDGAPRLLSRRGGRPELASSSTDPTPECPDSADRSDAATASEGAPEAYERGFAAGRAAGYAAAAEEARSLAVQQGYQEGLERGLQEGRDQALDAARRAQERTQHEAAQRLATLDSLLASLPVQMKARLHACEDDMVALCHAVVCRVLGDSVAFGDGAARLVRAAVAACADESALAAGDVTLTAIHVHPRDLERLSADQSLAGWLAPRLGRAGAQDAVVPWVSDESVGLGGCVVRSTEGSLDARLATQLAALTQWLARTHVAQTPSEGGRVER